MPELPDWLRGIALMGKDDGNYVVVKVKETGEMYAILQGDYEGALRTVRLDDEGRMSAFVIDSIDAWGNLLSIGNAELAARLGALQTYDGRGFYQFGDDFRHGMASWQVGEDGDDAEVALTPITFERGGYSVKLTGGSTDPWYASITRRLSLVTSNVIGIEAGIAIAGNIDRVELSATIYTGAKYHMVAVIYDEDEKELQVRTPGPAYPAFETAYEMHHHQVAFHMFKVVFNISTEKYVRALVSGVEYDLSAYDTDSAGDFTEAYAIVSVILYSRDEENNVVYVDHLIVTNQEP